MFLFNLFCLGLSVLDDIESAIPEIIVKVPVSVVFIGTNSIIKQDELSQESLENWFKNLDFTTFQNMKNSTDQFITSEVSKAPPMKYKFTFSVFKLPDEVHTIFEEILKYTARWSSDKKRKYVHFYVVEQVLQSLVDYYKIPNIAFFPLCSSEYSYYYCEGMENAERMSVRKTQAFPEDMPLNITFSKDKSWSSQVNDLLKMSKNGNPTFFSGWNDASSLFSRLNASEFLREELVSNAYKGGNRCSQNWFTSGRIFWSDMQHIIAKAQESLDPASVKALDIRNEIETTNSSFGKFCTGYLTDSKQREYCAHLHKYINQLVQQYKEVSGKSDMKTSYTGTQTKFLGMLSGIILDGLKEVITPVTPTFETPFAKSLRISITMINDTKKVFPTNDYSKYMSTYLLKGMSAVYGFENIQLNEWPGLGIPISTRVKPCDETIEIRNYDDYRCIDKMLFREDLSAFEVPHELRSDANKTEREVVTTVIVGADAPILLSKSSPAFSYDWITLATFTVNSPDIRPLLRSTLVHMYGLTHGEGWNSATIMSPSSTHYPLGQLSKDVAYRNAMRSFLSKGRAKIIQRIKTIKELLDFAEEVGAGNANISKHAIIEQIQNYGRSIDEILDLCEKFEFHQMRLELNRHRQKQKQLSKQLKEIARELDENLCSVAPPILMKSKGTVLDSLDSLAVIAFPAWIGTLFIALLTLFIVFSRKIKMA